MATHGDQPLWDIPLLSGCPGRNDETWQGADRERDQWRGIESPPFLSASVASNAAVIRLSEELAAETERHGVALFAIDPGWMSTAMTAYLSDSPQGLRWTPSGRPRHGTSGRS